MQAALTHCIFSLALSFTLCGCSATGALDATRSNIPQRAPTDSLKELTIKNERLNVSATFFLSGKEGEVEIWRSKDNRVLSFRSGILIASRGFGNDVMVRDASPTIAALSESVSIYERRERSLTSDNRDYLSTSACVMRKSGDIRIRLLILESCRDENGQAFESYYWLAPNGAILESRQWVGAIPLIVKRSMSQP